MKPRHRSDTNAAEIVNALRSAGCHVVPFESPKEGEPDLLVGFLGRLDLIEIKSAKGHLSTDQKEAHEDWARVGIRVHTVRSQNDALRAVGIIGERKEQNDSALELLADSFLARRRQKNRAEEMKLRLRPSVRKF